MATLSDDEDAILDHEIRAISPRGAIGGMVVARLFPPNIAERELSVGLVLKLSIELAHGALIEHGKLIQSGLSRDGNHIVRGVVGAGGLNMNPAVITIVLIAEDREATHVRIRGVAREGLIKQRAGQQAAERIASHFAELP